MLDSLYQNIGGRATINKLVEVFYKKAQADPQLGRFFGQANMTRLHSQQAMFLTMLFGGARKFTGQDLTAAHTGARQMGLDDNSFDALLRLFRESLEEIQVEKTYIEEVMQRLETTRDAVLGH